VLGSHDMSAFIHEWVRTWLAITIADLPRLMQISTLFLVFGTLEILLPAERGHSWTGRLRNITFTLLLVFLGIALTSVVVMFLPVAPRVYSPGGPVQTALVVFGHLVIFDLLFYWYHRAQHSYRWFWPVHELHHADAEMNVTSGMRTYFLEYPLQTLFLSTPTALIVGIDPSAAMLLPLIMVTWLYLAHANIRVHFGRLSPLLCGPQVHRIHHSVEAHHRDKNFAQFFPIYDVLFGTYYGPSREEYPHTGTATLATDEPIPHVLVRPFKVWRALLLRVIERMCRDSMRR
jgi:sterol desaturase/sphingolipid hydroxylase (fatty acid hydroxylase superfamily)